MNAQSLYHELTSRGVRLWVEADNLKLEAPRGLLSEDDLVTLRQHKADLLETLRSRQGRCPHCHDAADLQDRQRDVWWCARCREFFDSGGKAIPPATQPQPLTLEQVEPANLVADLLAAGCAFVDDGEHFGVRLPFKISASLLARLEVADMQKVRQAAAKLAEMEEVAERWVN